MSQAKRRQLLFAAGAVLAARLARAQPSKIWRIGALSAESRAGEEMRLETLRAGLRDLGYVEGRNIVIDARWADGNYGRLPDLAAELVHLKADVIVTYGTKATLGAKRATTAVPIVMASSGDIVSLGVVGSLAHPGGNITGSINLGRELGPKRLQLITEVMPRVAKVAYIVNPDNLAFGPNLQAMWATAKSLKLELQVFEARNAEQIEQALADIASKRIGVFVLQDDTLFAVHARKIVHSAEKRHLLSAGGTTFGRAGGALGYGPDVRALDRRAAYFIDKIFKGANPGDLPIEQASKFETIVNLKSATALGVKIPQSLLLRADRVIE